VNYFVGSSGSLSGASISITRNQFIGNKAVKNGGALHLYWDCLWISDTEFISNAAVNGGALYYINLGNYFVTQLMKILDETENKKYGGMKNVSFIQNSASNVGGAMKLFFEYSQLKTNQMIFEGNFDKNNQAIHQGGPSCYLLSFYDLIIMDQLTSYGNLEDLVKDSELTVLNNIFCTHFNK